MKKTLIKMTTVAIASAFAFAPLAIADEKEGGKKKRPERPEGRGPRGGDPTEMLGKIFDKIDADGSGTITLEELKAHPGRPRGHRGGEGRKRPEGAKRPEGSKKPEGGKRPEPPSVEERFAAMDAAGDGEVTKEQFVAAAKERFAKRRAGRDGAEGKGGKGGKGKKHPAVEDGKS